jgi:hypothetical protein
MLTLLSWSTEAPLSNSSRRQFRSPLTAARCKGTKPSCTGEGRHMPWRPQRANVQQPLQYTHIVGQVKCCPPVQQLPQAIQVAVLGGPVGLVVTQGVLPGSRMQCCSPSL